MCAAKEDAADDGGAAREGTGGFPADAPAGGRDVVRRGAGDDGRQRWRC